MSDFGKINNPPHRLIGGILSIVCLLSGAAQAAELKETCLALVNSGLVDTRNREFVVERLVSEFNEFCSSETDLSTSLSKRSSSFQLGFKGFELGASGSKSGATTSEKYKAACAAGESRFADYMRVSESTSTGSLLASYAVECVRILKDERQSRIFGQVDVSSDDKGFSAIVTYMPGEVGLVYELEAIPNARLRTH